MRPIYDLQSVFAGQIQDAEAKGTKQDDCAIGIVTDNKDPKKLGRVKVKIPVPSRRPVPLSIAGDITAPSACRRFAS